LLNLNALDLGIGLVFLGVRQNDLVILFGICGGLHPHHHAAGFGLVQDVRRDNFHHDGKAHCGRDLRSLGRGLGDTLLRNRDAVSVTNQLAFGRRQTCALVRPDCIENFADSIFGIRHWLPP
jgi:hypothetical protein